MKLNAVNAAFSILEGGYHLAGRSRNTKSLWQSRNVIAVAHPNVEFERELVDQGRFTAQNFYASMPVFTSSGRFAPSSYPVRVR